jgi:hypothetical protein
MIIKSLENVCYLLLAVAVAGAEGGEGVGGFSIAFGSPSDAGLNNKLSNSLSCCCCRAAYVDGIAAFVGDTDDDDNGGVDVCPAAARASFGGNV